MFDKPKQKALNASIKHVRQALKIRHRMGTFDHLGLEGLNNWMLKNMPEQGHWELATQEKFMKLFNAVSTDNIESFYPILWLACPRWYYRDQNQPINWPLEFERLISTMREKMRKGSGAVSYK